MGDYIAEYFDALTGVELSEVRAALERLAPIQVLAHSGVPASVTETLVETSLATVAVGAGIMGINDCLRITSLWSYPTSANVKSLRTKFGSAEFSALVPTSTRSIQYMTLISNRGSTNSQVAASSTNIGLASSGSTPLTASVDTSVAQSIVLSAQLADAAETITLERYLVELVRG